MQVKRRTGERGPFRAEHLRAGDPYELSNGHPVYCAPTGGRASGPNHLGSSVVGWDPAVKEVGVDTGYSPEQGTLRAPDVAVGNVPDRPGWVKGVPELAIEYADVGQDEESLKEKIDDLLAAGTRLLWVVRLNGPRRVEVHEPRRKVRVALPGQLLSAPGILKNAVRVEALYDRSEAEKSTLTNLLQRRGYEDLDAVLAAGREQGLAAGREQGLAAGREQGLAAGREQGLAAGREQGLAAGREQGLVAGREQGLEQGVLEGKRDALRRVLDRRGLRLTKTAAAKISSCRSERELDRWLDRALVASATAEVFRRGSR
ncbi:Uma2 family endonuclease [Sorangium sp. So ce1000]|uniref:Uma2 family endonuclease n=1 Tax=Sorangium sp. So ce1000 TaxID=3133325 RepID=UPI003F5FD93E